MYVARSTEKREKERGGERVEGKPGVIKAGPPLLPHLQLVTITISTTTTDCYHHRFESTVPAPFGWPRTLTRVGGGAVEVLPRVPSLLF